MTFPLPRGKGEDRWAGRVWPIAITLGLLTVVVVNIVFIVVAVGGADPVVESYESGEG